MKLDNFLSTFKQSGRENNYGKKYHEVGSTALLNLPELQDLFNSIGGGIFEDGLFNIHNVGSSYLWTELTFEYFKKYRGKSICFGFDWVGRQYAVNYSDSKTMILLLDPATAEAFTLESDIKSFLTEYLDELKYEQLELEKFVTLKKSLSEFQFNQCLGFKQFLFLGGKDQLDNFELIDIEVYWELSYQVYLKTKNLPAGTLVNLSLK